MHIILTHEQADFDALGALLGAALLNDHALAVLPRRMNRNARSFIKLYGAELPFVDQRDLPHETIESITLVDTQSLITLKGMTLNTNVFVIDHHQQRSDFPEDWTYTGERVGSCTTLLAENLRDHNGGLNALNATLLLLGIYEDTGSMTYVSTTVRDVRAVAFLLEQGASLRLASEYLNPPLSIEQRNLYDRLLAAAQSHIIHGENIIICAAEDTELTEEVSSITHKLRDLLDPDALFMLVATGDGIRMVARSTTDQIDVARIAGHFKGGGHERASAALIRPEEHPGVTLESVKNELLKILPGYIRPEVTIGQIMSRQPRLLGPQTTAQEALRFMQRYGYEGYPVVKDGKVIGLLTRRAVDRAISHKLNLPAASLMDAGEIAISSRDSIDSLQKIMIESGWGQIPVVDPDHHRIVGIVTRTDLLKILSADESRLPGKTNLAVRLESALPAARLQLLKAVAQQALNQHLPLFIVGGFVRDLLLGRPGMDFDLVVEGDAILLVRELSTRFGGRVVTHSRFGTAKWWVSEIGDKLVNELDPTGKSDPIGLPEFLDLISARTEFYEHPTALPTVERGSIKLDLHRRDFTINTLALRLDGRHYGELIDHFGGEADLQRGLVRVLHSLSFIDDPTRMLRAVRFEQRFEFTIETRTLQLMEEARPLLRQVSGERLRHELDLILAEDHCISMLDRLQDLNLLQSIHPVLRWTDNHRKTVEAVLSQPIDPLWGVGERWANLPIRRILAYLVWLAGCQSEETDSIAQRLRFNAQLRNALNSITRLLPIISRLTQKRPSQVADSLDGVQPIVLYVMTYLVNTDPERQLLRQYMIEWRNTRPTITGEMLVEKLGKPGPAVRWILTRLRAGWLDGEISSKQQEEDRLTSLLQQIPNDILVP